MTRCPPDPAPVPTRHAPATIPDPLWAAACRAVAPLLRPDDVVLAPVGDWRGLPVPVRGYTSRIDLADATVLILHKGHIAALRRPDLRHVWEGWQCVFANPVFVCFATGRRLPVDMRRSPQRGYTRLLRDTMQSEQLKRRPGTVFLLHIPKTAGTSVWSALARQVRSKVYYHSAEAFRFNPPAPGAFDLVGGHVPLHLLLPHLRPQDQLVGLLRCPTQRFRSAFLHSRRAAVDPLTLTPAMRAMRETSLPAFLGTTDAAMETRQQLLMLGFAFDRPWHRMLDDAILAEAVRQVSRPGAYFFPVERMDAFLDVLAALLGTRRIVPARLNEADGRQQAADIAEFESMSDAVRAENAAERALFTLVRDAAGRHDRDAGSGRAAPRAAYGAAAALVTLWHALTGI